MLVNFSKTTWNGILEDSSLQFYYDSQESIDDLYTRVIRIDEDSNGQSWYHTTKQIRLIEMLHFVFKRYLALIPAG
jgi:hypothetical protein